MHQDEYPGVIFAHALRKSQTECRPPVRELGMRLKPAFEQLLIGWKAQGYELVPTQTIFAALPRNMQSQLVLPYFAAEQGEIAGRSGTLLLQGKPFLPIIEEAA